MYLSAYNKTQHLLHAFRVTDRGQQRSIVNSDITYFKVFHIRFYFLYTISRTVVTAHEGTLRVYLSIPLMSQAQEFELRQLCTNW